MKKLSLGAAIVFCLLSLCGARVFSAGEPPGGVTLRVAIADDKNFVTLYIKEPYSMHAAGSDRLLLAEPAIWTRVIAVKDGLLIRDRLFKVTGVRISTGRDSKMYIDKRPFRGVIDIVKKPDGKLMVINSIDMEEYLYGVLYNEVSHRWPIEALKAQSIASRTFALYQARQNRLQPYDLRSDIYSQVYTGSDFERWSTTAAVNATKGKVLTYKGELMPSYFHATCAGRTEDSSALWKIDIPPLDGVACGFCGESPHYRWIKDIPLWILERKLKDGGYKIGRIVSFNVLSRNGSGRVDRLEIKDAGGASVIMTGKDFRQMIGPNELRSAKFDASLVLGQLFLSGWGWGHGVGMCQWGAYGQAKQGRKAEEILSFYYPQAEITTIDKLKP